MSPRLALGCVLSLFVACAPAGTPTTTAQGGGAVSPPTTPAAGGAIIDEAVTTAVAAGAATRVLVVFDRAQLAAAAPMDLLMSSPQAVGRTLQFASAKQDLFAAAPDGLDVLTDFESLPITHAEVRTADALAHLAADPRVLRVVADAQLHTQLAESLPLINQPTAAAQGKDGTGTAVAVLDTGADYRVADLGNCTAVGTPASCRVVYAQDFATQDNQLDDSGRHGTNTSSIVARVAPGAKIIALDVFDGSGAYTSVIINAINWVIANRATYNISAMNLSLGGGSSTTTCDTDPMAVALAEARAVGVLAAVATGNSATPNAISSPACGSAAVSVGAVYDSNVGGLSASVCHDTTTVTDQVTCFSNSASFQTMLAPGAYITAGGVTMAGTSQATPHVAGAIAVLHAAFPNETPTQLVTRLTSTGKPVTDARQGRVLPRLDLAAASAGCIFRLSPGTQTLPSSAADVTVSLQTGAGCEWSLSSSDGWLTVVTPASGIGPLEVGLHLAANTGALRTGTLTLTPKAGGAAVTATLSQGLDTTPPTGTVVINGGAAWTKSATVALTISASDTGGVASMCVTNSTSCTAWEAYDTAKTWRLAGTSGTQTVRVFFKDVRGNATTLAQAASDTVGADTTLPTGAVATATAADASVTLGWTAGSDSGSGFAQYVVVYATGATPPASCALGTVAYTGSERTFTHTGLTNGTSYAYRVCAQDNAGNYSAGSAVTAQPRPEFDGPVPMLSINGGASATNALAVTLSIGGTDASTITAMCLSATTTCTAWEAYQPSRAYTLPNRQGAITVFVRLKDQWGNASAAPASATITYDSVAPTGGALSAAWGDAAVTLSWTSATDATSKVGGYVITSATGATAPTNCRSGTVVATVTTSPYTHTGLTNGTRYAYRVCPVDNAGNVGTGLTASAMPKPEADGPVGSVVINGGASATNVAAVSVTLSATDASRVTDVCLASTAACTAWQTFANTKAFTLPTTQGTRTVYALFRDEWGNVSATPATATIVYDTVAPAGGGLTASYGDANTTLSWTAATDATTGVAAYKVVYAAGATAPATCAAGTLAGTVSASPFVHAGLTNGTTYAYRVCAVDGAGNVATGWTASSMPKPEAVGPTGTITLNGGASWARSVALAVTLSASDESTITQMCVSTGASCAAWVAYAPSATVTVTATAGTKTVSAWFKDQWGNVSASAASASIGLDTTAPSQPALTATAGSTQVSLSWAEASDSGSGVAGYKLVALTGTATPGSACATGTVLATSGTSFVHTGLTAGTAVNYRLCAVDAAGNVSAGAAATARPLP